MPAPLRYYAEYTAAGGASDWGDWGWHVFDRDSTFGAGDKLPICKCWTRSDAFKIRDALNERIKKTPT